MRDRRSGEGALAWDQLDLLPGGEGVGGRQGACQPPAGGGGYLDERTPSELREGAEKKFADSGDRRVDGGGGSRRERRRRFLPVVDNVLGAREAALVGELDVMGMPDWFLEIADAIGFDHTLAMWRILDAQRELQSDDGLMINLQLRPFASYQRYQRNRFIESLGALGMPVAEIRLKVKRELGEDLSLRHILRLAGRRRVAA